MKCPGCKRTQMQRRTNCEHCGQRLPRGPYLNDDCFIVFDPNSAEDMRVVSQYLFGKRGAEKPCPK